MTMDQPPQENTSHLFKLSEKWELERTFYEAGVDAALYDALQLARDSELPPPQVR